MLPAVWAPRDQNLLATDLAPPHASRPWTTIREICLTAADAVPRKFRCLARVVDHWPRDVHEVCLPGFRRLVPLLMTCAPPLSLLLKPPSVPVSSAAGGRLRTERRNGCGQSSSSWKMPQVTLRCSFGDQMRTASLREPGCTHVICMKTLRLVILAACTCQGLPRMAACHAQAVLASTYTERGNGCLADAGTVEVRFALLDPRECCL